MSEGSPSRSAGVERISRARRWGADLIDVACDPLYVQLAAKVSAADTTASRWILTCWGCGAEDDCGDEFDAFSGPRFGTTTGALLNRGRGCFQVVTFRHRSAILTWINRSSWRFGSGGGWCDWIHRGGTAPVRSAPAPGALIGGGSDPGRAMRSAGPHHGGALKVLCALGALAVNCRWGCAGDSGVGSAQR